MLRKNIEDTDLIISEILKRADPDDRILRKNLKKVQKNPKAHLDILWGYCFEYDIELELDDVQKDIAEEQSLRDRIYAIDCRLGELADLAPTFHEALWEGANWTKEEEDRVSTEMRKLNAEREQLKEELRRKTTRLA